MKTSQSSSTSRILQHRLTMKVLLQWWIDTHTLWWLILTFCCENVYVHFTWWAHCQRQVAFLRKVQDFAFSPSVHTFKQKGTIRLTMTVTWQYWLVYSVSDTVQDLSLSWPSVLSSGIQNAISWSLGCFRAEVLAVYFITIFSHMTLSIRRCNFLLEYRFTLCIAGDIDLSAKFISKFDNPERAEVYTSTEVYYPSGTLNCQGVV